jgi:hypothetical protein
MNAFLAERVPGEQCCQTLILKVLEIFFDKKYKLFKGSKFEHWTME